MPFANNIMPIQLGTLAPPFVYGDGKLTLASWNTQGDAATCNVLEQYSLERMKMTVEAYKDGLLMIDITPTCFIAIWHDAPLAVSMGGKVVLAQAFGEAIGPINTLRELWGLKALPGNHAPKDPHVRFTFEEDVYEYLAEHWPGAKQSKLPGSKVNPTPLKLQEFVILLQKVPSWFSRITAEHITMSEYIGYWML